MNSFLYINVKGVFLSLISLVFFYNLTSDQYYKGFFVFIVLLKDRCHTVLQNIFISFVSWASLNTTVNHILPILGH